MPERHPPGVLEEHLAALCPELRAVIEDAAASGNPVIETWRGFGQAVRLRSPRPVLSDITPEAKALLRYRSVNDFHYWLGEIHCQQHPGWFVVLPYNGPTDDQLPDLGLGPYANR